MSIPRLVDKGGQDRAFENDEIQFRPIGSEILSLEGLENLDQQADQSPLMVPNTRTPISLSSVAGSGVKHDRARADALHRSLSIEPAPNFTIC